MIQQFKNDLISSVVFWSFGSTFTIRHLQNDLNKIFLKDDNNDFVSNVVFWSISQSAKRLYSDYYKT